MNMHPEDVKAAVRKTGISLSELARRHGLSESSGSRALYVPVPSMNRAIAKHLGRGVFDIWPEWFDSNGERMLRFNRKSNTGRPRPQRQKGRAA